MYLTTVTKETIYAIFADHSFMTYNSLEEAINCRPVFIIKEVEGSWKNAEYSNHGYYYFIFNSNGEECNLSFGNWRATNLDMGISGKEGWYVKDKPYFSIIAPDGQIQSEEVGTKMVRIEGVIQTIEYLEKLSPFVNWIHFKTEMENIELKKEVELLKKTLADLDAKIQTTN